MKTLRTLIAGVLLLATSVLAQQVGGTTNWKNGPTPQSNSNSTVNAQAVNQAPSSISTTDCLAAVTISVPCVAYQHAFTALGVASTTGTITLYSSNAPANATFLLCGSVMVTTPATAGTAAFAISWTTPGGLVQNGAWLISGSLTSTGLSNAGCTTVVTKANTSLSFVISAQGATGSPVWESDPVVVRLF